jgi:hypothetical protein
LTKRTFLQTVGAGISALRLVVGGLAPSPARPQDRAGKFTPIDCSRYYTASPADFGPPDPAVTPGGPSAAGQPIRTPAGNHAFRGIPFEFGRAGDGEKSWIALSTSARPWSVSSVEIPIRRKAAFLCFTQFCDWDESERSPKGVEEFEKAGELLAEVVLLYEDGTEERKPIRRRFEVNSLTYPWGHDCFTAVPHRQYAPANLTDPLPSAALWGLLQTSVRTAPAGGDARGTLWLASIENPAPDKTIRALRVESRSEASLAVCGLTLYHGQPDPLRYERLSLFQISLPAGADDAAWEVSVDLGIVGRTYRLPSFEPETWLSSDVVGLGERREAVRPRVLYAEITASPGATLTLRNTKTGAMHDFDLGRILAEGNSTAERGGAQIEVLEREKTWIRGRVIDESTGRPTAARLSFRSRDGRYIPPYGHRTEVNPNWFQDYGADVQIQNTPYAYVDGSFQIELPVGDVYVEVAKGFEYEPVRKKLAIQPGLRELDLPVSRFEDLRSRNWVSADSHVHFLSPSTAILEGQAEGLNLINLLAAQWGDLYTNVGDLPHGHLTSRDGDTVVAVGTENRQHLLGHLALLGGHGEPVFPMSASGPSEAYIGDPLWNALADWADSCRERDGLVVAVHFPYPTAELAADIVLGKIDAVELQPRQMGEEFRSLRFLEWYRYLNCGYRLPAVGGTDKMGAWIAAGAFRAYAHLGGDEFSFESWARAVRRGNTFMTSGPLLLFEADGRQPGAEITMRGRDGRVEIQARARSTVPIHRLEIVVNGEVVASREEPDGDREIVLREPIAVRAPGWIAARCASRTAYGGIQVAAHTSPVYLAVPGQDLFSPPVAAYLLTLIDGSEEWVNKLATRADAARHDRVLRVLRAARERLHARMHRHGMA